MAIFPQVQSPCPYKGKLSDILDGEVCQLCKREVFDLTMMSDEQRRAFMKSCSSEVCVTYRFAVRPVVIAAAVAAAIIGPPTAVAACEATETTELVVVGGIKDPANVEYIRDASSDAVPDLPIVYETWRGSPAPAGTGQVKRNAAKIQIDLAKRF
jgi:predicted Fe-S protein YdhL (DUF1289 family)